MNIAEIIDYLTIIFLIIFSILGLFLFIALMGITRNINKIKNQLESANEKIESLGWNPDYSLDDGIKELIKGYQIIDPNIFNNL